MSTFDFDVAVLIGRFQPFHNGHAALLAKALESASRVIIVLGSALQARSAKNPFTWEERAAMISSTLNDEEQTRLQFIPMRDYYDDRRWAESVQALVKPHCSNTDKVALIGYLKDASSQYLNRFPEWQFIAAQQQGDIDATSLRQIYFEGDDVVTTQALLKGLVPERVAHYLKGWARLPHYAKMRAEHIAVEENIRKYGKGPFITVDAVVTAADHVLLIRRGGTPGNGLLAIPGGYLEPRERVLQGAIRELREETGLAILDSSMEAALHGVAVFDHPDRSQRGRNITHAHYFALKQSRTPQVEAADDAAETLWVPIAELAAMEDQFFSDHFNILNHFLTLTS